MIEKIAIHSCQKEDINELYLQAVRNNSIKQIKWCVSKGADIHYQNDFALDMATTFNHLKVLKFLVGELNLDVSKKQICLYEACRHNNIEMMYFLITDCNMSVHEEENRPIINALLSDSLEAFLYLKEKGAKLDTVEVSSSLNKKYEINVLADLAYMFDSINCMCEILPTCRDVFFSNDNVNHLLNAKKLVMDMDKPITKYVMRDLLKHSPSTIKIIEHSADSLNISEKEKFHRFITWLKLDVGLTEKSVTKKVKL